MADEESVEFRLEEMARGFNGWWHSSPVLTSTPKKARDTADFPNKVLFIEVEEIHPPASSQPDSSSNCHP